MIMLKDPIIDEIHFNRKKIWKECNDDFANYIKLNKEKTEEYKKQGWKIVSKEELKEMELLEHK